MTLPKVGGYEITGVEATIFWIVVSFTILVLALSLGLFFMWIYYSWIKRNNSKNYTGEDITKYMFEKTGTDVKVKSAWIYLKYWNYNKRRGTHKLRPWTFNRRSIWTLMEAAQQAYATTIRLKKGKQYWLLFRIPGIFKVAGLIASSGLFYLGIKDISDIQDIDYTNWLWIGLGITVLLISYTIADVGKIFVLWRNVVPMLKESGLSETELKAINRIYFWRLIYSIAVVILELIKLVFEIASKKSEYKSN